MNATLPSTLVSALLLASAAIVPQSGELNVVMKRPLPPPGELLVVQQELSPGELSQEERRRGVVQPTRRVRDSFFQQTSNGAERRLLWSEEFSDWGKEAGTVGVGEVLDASLVDGWNLVYVCRNNDFIYATIVDVHDGGRTLLLPQDTRLVNGSTPAFFVANARIDGAILFDTLRVTLTDSRTKASVSFSLRKEGQRFQWIRNADGAKKSAGVP